MLLGARRCAGAGGAGRPAANPLQHAAASYNGGQMGQTDRQTDTVPLRIDSAAYCAGTVNTAVVDNLHSGAAVGE